MMADKGVLSAFDLSDSVSGDVLEHVSQHPVDNSGDVGRALQALEGARQALVYAAAAAEASAFARAAHSENTLRGYAVDWRSWTRWAEANACRALPADAGDVAVYVAYRARASSPATLRRGLAAIAAAHRAAGAGDPTKDGRVKAVLRGILRSRGTATRRKSPLVVEAMRHVLATCAYDVRGRRDRALLLIGWGAALRRSELVALDWADCEIADEGLIVRVRRSKVDQLGRGVAIGIPHAKDPRHDAVRALLDWQQVFLGDRGAVFRPVTRSGYILERRLGAREVARVVKRVASRAGLQGDYSGHSLRAGFATAAAAAGASERAIMAQTRHQSVTVMRQYIRPASIWIENAAAIAAL